MRKKLVSALLCAAMTISMLAGCGNDSGESGNSGAADGGNSSQSGAGGVESDTGNGGEDGGSEAAGLPPMTTENIELTYMNFDNKVLTEYLAEKFTEKYPNIKVNVIYEVAGEDYNNSLLNLVNIGETPDCFMILGNCDFALSNRLLGDMTEYWENDPENENILPSINGAKLGYYGTDTKLSTPMKFFPDALYADMAVFEKLNVAMPPTDWTWDEMVQAFKDVTSPDQGIYGFNQFHSIVTYYPVASDPNCIGEFGWNGKEFDLTNWAVGVNTLADLMKGKYRAPMTEEEIVAWLGANEWAGYSGKIGFQIDAYWTYLNLFDTDDYRNKGIEFVPYATPSVEGTDAKYKFGVLDFGGISSGTKYPREAYELLKFMGWGLDGWKAKMEGYKTLVDEAAGNIEIWKQSMPAPLTMDEGIWIDYQTTFFPTLKKAEGEQTEKDKKYGQYFDDYFDQVRQGCVPFGDCQIPGFAGFVGADGPYAGVEDSVFNGEKNASDWVRELTEKANEYNRQAMEDAGLTPAQ